MPFAALVDPASGQYLVERHEVGVAPSAHVYVQCLRRQRELPRAAPTQALIVGATEPDRRRFPALGALAGAQAESRVVAALYPSARLLAGERATRAAVLGQLSQGPQVLHLAGHSLVNASRPDLSMFLLAAGPQPRDSGVVYAHEIEEWPLAKTSLAVLAGCGTAAGEISASEGAMSLSRPFLAAGVPAVVGSLWRIDDDASASLMTTFHRRLRAGDDPQSALRRAQLAEIRKGGAAADPGTWAPFQLIGGVLPSETGGGAG